MPLAFGDNFIEVVVTAEDTTTTKTYSITVTRALPVATRTISPQTVVPGGTFAVTITYGDYGGLGGVDEILPDGFSWVFVHLYDLPTKITAKPKPANPQLLEITMLGKVDTFTYEVTAADTPDTYTFSGIIFDDNRMHHDVVGDSEITVEESPALVLSLSTLRFNEDTSATYTARLGQLPTADVTVAITSDNTDVTVSPASLTFTPANWNTRQTVTVNAAQDTDDNYDTATLTHAVTSTDPNYNNIMNGGVDVSVTDDDVTVMFGADAYTVPEGDRVKVTVTLSAALDFYTRVNIGHAPQGGAKKNEYGVDGTAQFERGATSTTINFLTTDDVKDDDGGERAAQFRADAPAARGERGDSGHDHGEHHRRRRAAWLDIFAHGTDGRRGRHEHVHRGAELEASRRHRDG